RRKRLACGRRASPRQPRRRAVGRRAACRAVRSPARACAAIAAASTSTQRPSSARAGGPAASATRSSAAAVTPPTPPHPHPRAAPPPPPAPTPPPTHLPAPPLPPAKRAPRRGPDDGMQAPGVRGFRDIAADTEDLGRAAAQANRAARRTYANVPSPSPEFDRIEPSLEDRGADPDTPYSWDDTIEEPERQAPLSPLPPAPRARIGVDRDREPKRARGATVFPFKSAIAIGIVLILVGAAILWGKSLINGVSGLFKSQ